MIRRQKKSKPTSIVFMVQKLLYFLVCLRFMSVPSKYIQTMSLFRRGFGIGIEHLNSIYSETTDETKKL